MRRPDSPVDDDLSVFHHPLHTAENDRDVVERILCHSARLSGATGMGVKVRKRHKYKHHSGLTGLRRGRTMIPTTLKGGDLDSTGIRFHRMRAEDHDLDKNGKPTTADTQFALAA